LNNAFQIAAGNCGQFVEEVLKDNAVDEKLQQEILANYISQISGVLDPLWSSKMRRILEMIRFRPDLTNVFSERMKSYPNVFFNNIQTILEIFQPSVTAAFSQSIFLAFQIPSLIPLIVRGSLNEAIHR